MATKSSSRRSSAVAAARRGYTVPDPVVPPAQQVSASPAPPATLASPESYDDRPAAVIVTTDRSGITVVTQFTAHDPSRAPRGERYDGIQPVRSSMQTGKPPISVDPNAHDVRFSRTFGL